MFHIEKRIVFKLTFLGLLILQMVNFSQIKSSCCIGKDIIGVDADVLDVRCWVN